MRYKLILFGFVIFFVGVVPLMAASDALPEPLLGWTEEETMTGVPGGIASRNYKKGNSDIVIAFMVNADAAQGVLMALNNPIIASGPGIEVITIQGQKALQSYFDGSGEISIVLDKKIIVTVMGSGLQSMEPLLAYAWAIYFNKIRRAAQV